jgi:hypothetical protein
MLKEIHAWWAQNLKHVPAAKKPAWGNNFLGPKPEVEPLSFAVSVVESPETFGVSWGLCSKACLRDDWRETTSSPLFVCRCNKATGPKPSRCRVETISCKLWTAHSPVLTELASQALILLSVAFFLPISTSWTFTSVDRLQGSG